MSASLSAETPSTDEQTARNFHTAAIASRTKAPKNFTNELYSLMKTPAFQAILRATRQLAAQTGSSEREAAESILQTVRKVDDIWSQYVFQEGIEKLRGPQSGSVSPVPSDENRFRF